MPRSEQLGQFQALRCLLEDMIFLRDSEVSKDQDKDIMSWFLNLLKGITLDAHSDLLHVLV